MKCSHGKRTSANSVFRFWTMCELCKTKTWGVWNAVQCSDCGCYMHETCASALQETFADSKTTRTYAIVASDDEKTRTKSNGIVGSVYKSILRSVAGRRRATEPAQWTGTARREAASCRAEIVKTAGKDAREDGPGPVTTVTAGSGRRCPQTRNPVDIVRVHADVSRREPKHVRLDTKDWNPVRVGPSLMVPINGGPIWITPPDSDFDPVSFGLEIPKPARVCPPPVWNPVRVGPPLLIPVNGGPIWVTPLD